MSVILFFIILLVLVLAHEAGHFFAAKRFGIRVDEFGFGFPPKLFGKKYGETEYTFNLLPLGGFVKIFGENPELEPSAQYGAGPDDKSRSFQYKPKWQQAIVLVAGVTANFLLAWLLFSFGFMSGFPTPVQSGMTDEAVTDIYLTVLRVSPNSPAEKAGLKLGDKITKVVSGNEILETPNPESLKSFIDTHQGSGIEIEYIRKNNLPQLVKLVPEEVKGTPMIGIAMDMVGVAKLPILKAFTEGMKLNCSIAVGMVKGLYVLIRDALVGEGSLEGLAGPVGIVSLVGSAYQFGFVYLLSFAAVISINLAVINLFPFPALDGGRLLFLLIEKIKGSALNPKFANMANTVGFVILILLVLLVTYNDIAKLI